MGPAGAQVGRRCPRHHDPAALLGAAGGIDAGSGSPDLRPGRLPGAGSAWRPAAPWRPPRRVPAQRGAGNHDPRRAARGHAGRWGAWRRSGSRNVDEPAGPVRESRNRHIHHAELRPLRAGRRTGPPAAHPAGRPMRGRGRLSLAGLAGVTVWLLLLRPAGATAAAPPAAGPPYPDAVTGQRVYDYAGIFSPGAVAEAERSIKTIEARTGAQVAIYTQVKPQSDTLALANDDALALMNQWGVGRKGFYDGAVILFDMQGNLQHGQVSLYAGSGFKAAYLTNMDRQAIFDNDMKPLLADGDFDGALHIALADVNAAATPQHRDQLNQARFINAAVGFGVALLAMALIILVLFRWYTHGRDPVYVDDNSVLMPAPPDGLTPAMATLLMDDRASSRTVSAAMVDLAARGLLRFHQNSEILSKKTTIGITGQMAQITTPEAALYQAVTR